MKLNRGLLLGEITVKYAGSSYSSAKVALAYDCVSIAEEWFNRPTGNSIFKGGSTNRLRRELRKYVKDRVDIDEHYRLSRSLQNGFIPAFVWWFIASSVIRWIVNRIIRLYL